MKTTATNFRKDLFGTLDRALNGESVEITYKGATVKLVATFQSTSKLSRAKRQNTVISEPDQLTDKSLMAEMEAAWEEDWKDI